MNACVCVYIYTHIHMYVCVSKGTQTEIKEEDLLCVLQHWPNLLQQAQIPFKKTYSYYQKNRREYI